MRRSEFEHAIRAVGSILGTDKVLVIGSEALHATLGSDLPEAAQRSVEVDVVVFGDQDGSKADLIDGSIGEVRRIGPGRFFAGQRQRRPKPATRGWRKGSARESVGYRPKAVNERLVRDTYGGPGEPGVVGLPTTPSTRLDQRPGLPLLSSSSRASNRFELTPRALP